MLSVIKKIRTTLKKTFLNTLRSDTGTKYPLWILAIVSVVLYFNTLFFDYNLDDGMMIKDNSFTKAGISGIKDILFHDSFVGCFGESQNLYSGGRYRPFSQITFAIEYEFFGLNPFWGHLGNILIYTFTCIFVYLILRRLLEKHKEKWLFSIPFIAALLFTAHPVHTEVVANIKGRDEILAFLFSIATLYFSIRYLDTKKAYNLIASSVSFLIAILSKENAVTFFAIVPLTLFVFTKSKMKDYIITFIPLIAGFVIYMFFRIEALGVLVSGEKVQTDILSDPFMFATTSERFATVFFTWGKYLKLLFFPHPLTHDYYPNYVSIVNWANYKMIISLAVYIVLIVYALITVWKKNIAAYAILFFLITFSATSNLFVNLGILMNERFMFTPLLGFTIIIAWLLINKLPAFITNEKTWNKAVITITIAVMLGYSAKTISRNFAWKDGRTLYMTDIKTSSNSGRCNICVAQFIYNDATDSINKNDKIKKDSLLNEAVWHLEKGVSIVTGSVPGWILLGACNVELDNYAKAEYCFEKILDKNPNYKNALDYLQLISQKYLNSKDFGNSINTYKTILKYQPENNNYKYQLAEIYLGWGKPDTSIMILNSIITKNPDYFQAYSKLGEIYGRYYNNLDKSIEFYLKAIAIKPDDVQTMENLGIVYAMKNNIQESLKYLNKAFELNPGDIQLCQNIAKVYMDSGDKNKASEYLQKANQLKKQ